MTSNLGQYFPLILKTFPKFDLKRSRKKNNEQSNGKKSQPSGVILKKKLFCKTHNNHARLL